MINYGKRKTMEKNYAKGNSGRNTSWQKIEQGREVQHG